MMATVLVSAPANGLKRVIRPGERSRHPPQRRRARARNGVALQSAGSFIAGTVKAARPERSQQALPLTLTSDKGRRRQIRLSVNKDRCRQTRRTANRYTDRRCECGRLRTKKTESRTTLRFSCICIAADQLIFRRSGSWSGEAASISICSLTILTAVAAASSPLLP